MPADLKLPDQFRCPYCNEPSLWAEFDEWDEDDRPTETGVHVTCEHEGTSTINHYQMPYVYWMPLQGRVYRWLVETGYKVKESEAETALHLEEWNKQLPLRYGSKSHDVWVPGQGWRPKQ